MFLSNALPPPSLRHPACPWPTCSDKTGTLTTNQMSVTRVACVTSDTGGLSEFEVTGTTYSTDGSILDMSARNLLRQPATQPCLWAAAMARCAESRAGRRQRGGGGRLSPAS